MNDQRLTDEELSDIERETEAIFAFGDTDYHVEDNFRRLLAEVRRTRAEITAIVELHPPTAMSSWGHRTCQHCDTPGYYQEWPCPTLVALGFEER